MTVAAKSLHFTLFRGTNKSSQFTLPLPPIFHPPFFLSNFPLPTPYPPFLISLVCLIRFHSFLIKIPNIPFLDYIQPDSQWKLPKP